MHQLKSNSFTTSLSTELYTTSNNSRSDTLAIKQKLIELIKPEDGIQYWSSFKNFIKAKIDRREFEEDVSRILNSDQLVGLHNSLVLSILYNTTRPESPPINPPGRPNLYTTGQGWYKRKRVQTPINQTNKSSKSKLEELDSKKRKLKESVLSLGQRERNRIKQIPKEKEKEKEYHQKHSNLYHSKNLPIDYLVREKVDNVTNTLLASKMKISSSTLYQDYMRCQQAPLCSESKQLPDSDTLKDRMSLIAYDSGLVNGVDNSAASLALIALEVHLKTILGDLLSLIRSDRSVVNSSLINPSTSKVPNSTSPNGVHVEKNDQTSVMVDSPQASTPSHPFPSHSNAEAESSSNQNLQSNLPKAAYQSSSSLRLRDLKTQGLAPHLTAKDFAALSEISPHSFVRCHPGALERLIATHTFSELCSSDEEEEDDERYHISTDLQGTSTSVNGQAWMNGSQSHLRSNGINGSHSNQSSSRLMSKTASFSPRSVNKTSKRGNSIRNHTYTSSSNPSSLLLTRSLLNGRKNPNLHLENLSSLTPTWSEFNENKTNHNLMNFENSSSPSFSKPNHSINSNLQDNRPNGGLYSPVLEPSSIRRRKSSTVREVKSLAAELFPEDVVMNTNHQKGSGSESENEDDHHHKKQHSRSIKLSNGNPNGNGVGGTGGSSGKKKGWDRIDTFRLLENVGN
ncbi:transcriptional regulator of RNA polII, SAGA, subunit-domain-containing protein [Melampsora americana]|nr:transcriptional regulator of RNA polII, SAGA, subunit-domain-containing protein [Melampsora americana]